MEVGGADGLAHGIPVAAHAAQRDLLLLHDVGQLLPHLLGLAQHCAALPGSEPKQHSAGA